MNPEKRDIQIRNRIWGSLLKSIPLHVLCHEREEIFIVILTLLDFSNSFSSDAPCPLMRIRSLNDRRVDDDVEGISLSVK